MANASVQVVEQIAVFGMTSRCVKYFVVLPAPPCYGMFEQTVSHTFKEVFDASI
jgi:hypothetical protein